MPEASTAAVRPPASVAIAVGAWLLSAIVCIGVAPLQGSVATIWLVAVLLFAVPGFLIVTALGLEPGDSPWSLVALSFGVGSGVLIPLAGVTRFAGQPLEYASFALLALETIPLAVIVQRWRAGSLPRFDYRGRSAADWSADALAGLAALLLGAFFVGFVSEEIRSGDLWYYLSYIAWMVQEPGREYLLHSVDPEEWNARLVSSAFLASEALITRLLRVDTSALQVFWSLLPTVFIPLALLSLYALGCALCRAARARALIVVAQLTLVFATLPYLLDRSSSGVRWAGTVLFYRISQDKVFLAYVLVPIAALAAVEYLRRGDRRWLAVVLFIGVAGVLTHPLGLPFLAIAIFPYAFVRAALRGETGAWRRTGALALLLVPLAGWPLLQTGEEGAPKTLADEAGFLRRQHLTRDSLQISSREENRFTAHPSLIRHPLMGAGIASGFALGALGLATRAGRRGGRGHAESDDTAGRENHLVRPNHLEREDDAGIDYAFALTAAIVAMLYLPGIPPLAGQIVTPYLLWRFTWLLPIALSLAFAIDALARIARIRLPAGAARAVPAMVAALVLLAAAALGVFGDFARARDLTRTLRPFPFDLPTARRISEGIAEQVGEERVLLDPLLQTLALAHTPRTQTVYWRMGSDPALFQRVTDFYSQRFLAPRHVELLREFEIPWVAVRKRVPIFEDIVRRPELFQRVAQIESVTLFRVRDAANARLPSSAIEHWRQQVAADPGSAQARTQLATALASEGRLDEAVGELGAALAIDEANSAAHAQLGTLAQNLGDYARAARHLRRGVELNPDDGFAANNLAWLLATCPIEALRDPQEAVRLAEGFALGRVVDASSLDTLAASYAAAGRFEDALRVARQSLDLLDGAGADTRAERARLAGYEEGRAYVEARLP